MTPAISFAPAPQQMPALQPQQQPQPSEATSQTPPAGAASLPKEAITALYKDAMSSYVDFKMKETVYQQLSGQPVEGTMGAVANNPFENAIPVGNTPQPVGPVPPEQPEQQPQQPAFQPGQYPPPAQIPASQPMV